MNTAHLRHYNFSVHYVKCGCIYFIWPIQYRQIYVDLGGTEAIKTSQISRRKIKRLLKVKLLKCHIIIIINNNYFGIYLVTETRYITEFRNRVLFMSNYDDIDCVFCGFVNIVLCKLDSSVDFLSYRLTTSLRSKYYR